MRLRYLELVDGLRVFYHFKVFKCLEIDSGVSRECDRGLDTCLSEIRLRRFGLESVGLSVWVGNMTKATER